MDDDVDGDRAPEAEPPPTKEREKRAGAKKASAAWWWERKSAAAVAAATALADFGFPEGDSSIVRGRFEKKWGWL